MEHTLHLSVLVLSLLAGTFSDTVASDTSPESNVHRVPLSALQSSESVSYHVPVAPPSSSAGSHGSHGTHVPHGAHESPRSHEGHGDHDSHGDHESHGGHENHGAHEGHDGHGTHGSHVIRGSQVAHGSLGTHRSHEGHSVYPPPSSSASASQRKFPAIAMLFPTTLTPYRSPSSSVLRDSHANKYHNSEPSYEGRRPSYHGEVPVARQPQTYTSVGKVHHFPYAHAPVEKRPQEPAYEVPNVHEPPPRFIFDRNQGPIPSPEHERQQVRPALHSYEQREQQQLYRGPKYGVSDPKPIPFQAEKPEIQSAYERPIKYGSPQSAEDLFGGPPSPFRSSRQELRPEERPEIARENRKQPQEPLSYTRYGRIPQGSRLEETPSTEKVTTYQGYPLGLFNSQNPASSGASSSGSGITASSRRRYNLVYIPVDVLKKLLTEAGYKKKK